MSITIELSPDLEATLRAEAERLHLPLSEYALRVLSAQTSTPAPQTAAQVVKYWEAGGLVGTRADIRDSQSHARQLRAEAERRDRS